MDGTLHIYLVLDPAFCPNRGGCRWGTVGNEMFALASARLEWATLSPVERAAPSFGGPHCDAELTLSVGIGIRARTKLSLEPHRCHLCPCSWIFARTPSSLDPKLSMLTGFELCLSLRRCPVRGPATNNDDCLDARRDQGLDPWWRVLYVVLLFVTLHRLLCHRRATSGGAQQQDPNTTERQRERGSQSGRGRENNNNSGPVPLHHPRPWRRQRGGYRLGAL